MPLPGQQAEPIALATSSESRDRLTPRLAKAATFFLFAALCVVSHFWIRRNVPETRGRTLEEIQDLWNPSTTRPPTAATPDP